MNPETPCTKCGFNLGLHRTSDEACPVPGTFINGDNARWRLDSKFVPRTDPAAICKHCGFAANEHPSGGSCPTQANTYFEPLEDYKYQSVEGLNINPGGASMYFREPALASSRTNLRKVVFARWATLEERQLAQPEAKPPANFTIQNIHGFFHCFGSACEEYEAGPGNYSTAIVEDMSGQVFEIFPSDMKFLS